MAATIVTHMMIALCNKSAPVPGHNSIYKQVVTIKRFESVTETEFISPTEQIIALQEGPQLYQADLVETPIAVSDQTSRFKKGVRSISETKTITEALVQKSSRTITEVKDILESIAVTKQVVRNISESKSVSDSISKSAIHPRTLPETTAISESLDIRRIYPIAIPETVTIPTETLTKIAIKIRALTTETTNIDEALVRLRSVSLQEEPITVLDQLAKSRRAIISLDFTAAQQSFLTTSFTTASFWFTASISDTLTKLAKPQAFNETQIITESLHSARQFPHILVENVGAISDTLARLPKHRITETVAVTDSIYNVTIKILSETQTAIAESLAKTRYYYRSINPRSFTDESFTTGAFESFAAPSVDVVAIDEELEAFALPNWQKVLNEIVPITELLTVTKPRTITEPATIISDSIAVQVPVPVVSGGGGGGGRRKRKRAPAWFNRRYIQPEPPKPEEPEEIPPRFIQVNISEPALSIGETVAATRTITKLMQIPIPTISAAASEPPPPKIIIIEKEKQIQPPPIIRAQDIIVSKPKPIEIEQNLLVSTQEYSDKRKSKAAAAQLDLLQELAALAELEALV
jgi:hypothetical protein